MGAKNPAALKGNRPFDESGKEEGRQVGRPERHQRTLHAPCTKIRRLNEQRRTAKAAKAVGEKIESGAHGYLGGGWAGTRQSAALYPIWLLAAKMATPPRRKIQQENLSTLRSG